MNNFHGTSPSIRAPQNVLAQAKIFQTNDHINAIKIEGSVTRVFRRALEFSGRVGKLNTRGARRQLGDDKRPRATLTIALAQRPEDHCPSLGRATKPQ